MSISSKALNFICSPSHTEGAITPKTAEFAAKWWAKFLPTEKPLPLKEALKVYNTDGSEGSKTINNVLDFARSAYKVTPEQHDLFVKILSDKILNKELDNYFKSTELSVDYHPPIELSESLNEAGITQGGYDDGVELFPFKTNMVISERDVVIKWGEGNIFHDEYDYTQDDTGYLCNFLRNTFSSSNEEL